MARFYTYKNDLVHLEIWELNESLHFFTSHTSLNTNEERHLKEIKNSQRQLEFAATRYVFQQSMGFKQHIQYQECGRPILNGGLHISISHCQKFIAIIVSNSGMPGIDIETISDRAHKIQKRFLNTQEQTFTGNSSTLNTLFWSSKEALFKMCHQQGIEFRTQLLLPSFKPANNGVFEAQINTPSQTVKIKLSYHIFEKIVLAWGVNYEPI